MSPTLLSSCSSAAMATTRVANCVSVSTPPVVPRRVVSIRPTDLGIAIVLPDSTPWLAGPRLPGAADVLSTATVAVSGEFSKIVVPSTLAAINHRYGSSADPARKPSSTRLTFSLSSCTRTPTSMNSMNFSL